MMPSTRCEVARHVPLRDLARRLAACRCFVGHDSGISHLAAAVGTPSVVLWGPTLEKVWRPLGDHVRCDKLCCRQWAMEIDFHQCVELFVAGCQGCAERCDAGIVDEYVAATEAIDTLSYR